MNLKQILLSGKYQILFTAIVVFVITSGILVLTKNDAASKTFFSIICFTASFYCYHNLKSNALKHLSKGVLFGLGASLFLLLTFTTIKAAFSDSQWDFMCFYMQGLLGKYNLDFYNPDSFKIVLDNIGFQYCFDESFRSEILSVGLLSPPITMLLLAPIAYLNLETSRIILSLLIFVIIIINSFLANMVFVKSNRSIFSILFIFIIIMLLPATITTINYNQMNFFLLFFLLLIFRNLNKPFAGIFLALSLIIKPIYGILILYYLFNKNWKPIAYFIGTVFILFLITGLIWGSDNIINFFKSPPTQRLPDSLYEQEVNQSLIGFFNRNLKLFGLSGTLIDVSCFLFAGILIVMSAVASKRLNEVNIHLSFLPFILCMLMIYPSSLWHYLVSLIPLIIYFLFLDHGEKYFWTLILPALYFSRSAAFFTYLYLWVGLLLIALIFLKNSDIKASLNLNLNLNLKSKGITNKE